MKLDNVDNMLLRRAGSGEPKFTRTSAILTTATAQRTAVTGSALRTVKRMTIDVYPGRGVRRVMEKPMHLCKSVHDCKNDGANDR